MTSPWFTFLSSIDEHGFIASGSSVKEIVKTLEKVAKTVLERGVTYDRSKAEAVPFFRNTPATTEQGVTRDQD